MITTVLKRLSHFLEQEEEAETGAMDVGTLYDGTLSFEDSPMTRQRLNDLLKQTPSLPLDAIHSAHFPS